MAIIIPHQSQTTIVTANGGQAAQYRSASDFIAPAQENIGRNLQQLAGGINTLGGVLYEAELQKRQEQTELALLEDIQTFQQDSKAWADDYQKNFQGKDALNAEADAQAFYKEKMDVLNQRWDGNKRAQLYIRRHVGEAAVSGINTMRDYGNRQQEAYKDSVFAGEKQMFLDSSSDGSKRPEEIRENFQTFAAKNVAYLVSKGMDPAAAQAQTEEIYREGSNINMYNRMSAQVQTSPAEVLRVLDGKPRSARLPEDVVALADSAAESSGVSSALVRAVIAAESGADTAGPSPAGERGLMQLKADTQRTLEQRHKIDGSSPEGNVTLGTRHLKELLGRYKGDEHLALMAYDWGTGNVDSFIKTGQGLKSEGNPAGAVPPETRRFVSSVLGEDDAFAGQILNPEQKSVLRSQAETAERERVTAEAFSHVQTLPPDEAFAFLSAPEQYGQMGLSAGDAKDVLGMYKTRIEYQRSVERQQKEAREAAAMSSAVGLFLGKEGQEPDPVAAYALIKNDPSFGGEMKQAVLRSFENGTVGKKDDPAFLANLIDRMTGEEPASDVELFAGVASGKATVGAKDRLSKLKELTEGTNGSMVKTTFKTLHNAFSGSTIAAGTPEAAAANYAAQTELLSAIEEAEKNGSLANILDPASKDFILPGIMARNRLSVHDQMIAVNRMLSQGGVAGKRTPGETPDQFLHRAPGARA